MFDLLKKKNEGLAFVFVIYDFVAKTYGVPVFLPTKDVALRQFADFLSGDPTFLYRKDFELHLVGYWDHKNGVLLPAKLFVYSSASVEDEVQRIRSIMKAESGAAVGAEPPQVAERKEL